MRLVFPTIEYGQAAWDFRQEHFDRGERVIHGGSGLDGADTFAAWLEKLQADLAREPSEERVPSTTFFGEVNGKIVGVVNIRHVLNSRLLNSYGHIGYGVRPTERRKGYAARMLSLALDKCREMGLEKVLISCDKTNLGSAGTILKNGGVLDKEFAEADGNILQQYWIVL